VHDNGREEQIETLRSLRLSRAAAFRKEIVPHFRYVFQSGFGLFVSAILFTAFIWYTDLIKAVPTHWPADLIGVIVITLAAVRAPLRTYFRSADEVFLLPMERQVLQGIIRPGLNTAITFAVIRTLFVFVLYWPIYSRSPVTAEFAQEHSLVGLAIVMVLIAGLNVYAGWRERLPAVRGWRFSLKVVRWLLTGLVVMALLLKPILFAIPLLLLVIVLIHYIGKIPSQHAVPWEKLIAEEDRVRQRWMAFLSWFVDVPTETSKPVRRKWISWLGDHYLWQHRWSWHYLYAKAFLRGETFGAFLRWVVIASAIIVVSENVWADAAIYFVAIMICGLQLSELRRVRFMETAATLPMKPERRLVAAAAIARATGIISVLLMGLVGIIELLIRGVATNTGGGIGRGFELWIPMIIVGLLWCGWWIPRKISKFTDEDDL
jgi:ABC-2 type transport system permease protein